VCVCVLLLQDLLQSCSAGSEIFWTIFNIFILIFHSILLHILFYYLYKIKKKINTRDIYIKVHITPTHFAGGLKQE
jgi:hypothetical protein